MSSAASARRAPDERPAPLAVPQWGPQTLDAPPQLDARYAPPVEKTAQCVQGWAPKRWTSLETTVNFSVDRYRVGPAAVLQINGELDADTGDLLIACAEAALTDVHHLVLDLSRSAFVDCGGLSALLKVEGSARRAGGSTRAAGVQGPAALLFDVFDVWEVLGGRHPVDLEVRRAVGTPAAITPSHPTSRCSSRARTASTASTLCASGG